MFDDVGATLERYRHIIENADEIIFRTDVSGTFTYVNPAAERLTGYGREELLGRSFLTLIDPDYQSAAQHFYQHQFDTRARSTYFEFPMVAKTGARIWLGQSVLTVFAGDGRIEGYEAIARDITYRRGIEEELARTRDAALQSARAKSEFLANVSHEVRTPLNGVLGMTDFLLGTELTPEQREYAELIRSSAENLLAIVNDVLDLSRVEAGKLTIEPIDFDLDELIDSVCEQFAARASEKRLKLRFHVDLNVVRALRGDSQRIRQVLLNLVGNAVKFTDRGEITVSVLQSEHGEESVQLRFVVTDTGIGIPEAVQAKLFTPFTQGDGTTTRRHGGSGLGLAVSKRLVEAMGGDVGLMSVAGEGSTFWFEVPLAKQAEDRIAPAHRWDLSAHRALLVDTEDVRRMMVARQLVSSRIGLDEATTPAAGLAAARARHYDAIVFDMRLGDHDGLAFARAIRADPANATTRLLLLTSFGRRRHDIDAFHTAGIDAFLLKPIRRAQLCDTLARLLESEPAPPAPPPEPQVTTHARVLLVEDNTVNQVVALGQLQRLGHECVVASSGLHALDVLRQSQFDIVLMDVQMPDIDGYEATRRIRELPAPLSKIPIVAITAHALPGEREKCLAAGMNDYLPKPVSLAQLGAAIRLWTTSIANKETESQAAVPDLLEHDDPYVLDRERVSSFLAINRTQEGFFEGLVKMFREDVPPRLDALRAAAASGDTNDLAFAAHALKSSCGSVGAKRMHAVAHALEQSARAGKLEGVSASIEQLAAEFRRAMAAFNGIVRRSGRHEPVRTQ
ncbi:MAG TPA: response regulator [Thermoanaerobaculia bacterium]|nr:response regulator [Thermoanaerobaculia bacterium]